jgi:hypothetical protein
VTAVASGAVERYLLEFNDALVAGAERRERILAEVEEHLRDATESLVAAGLSAGEAELEAVRRFGDPAQAAERFGADPLGRGQQASRWYEARRIAHPLAIPLILYGPLIALTAWAAIPMAMWLCVWLLASHIHRNIRARRATGATAVPGRLSGVAERLRLAMAGRWWLAQVLVWSAVGAYIAVAWSGVAAWFVAIAGYYLACGLVARWARPTCGDAESCVERRRRWAPRPAWVASALRGTAWTLALAGPLLLPEIVPGAAGHTGLTLLALAVFLVFCTPPTRRSRRWLHDRRPAAQVVLRTTPLLGALLFEAVRTPAMWMVLPIHILCIAYVAATREVSCSRYRSEMTRRGLLARIESATDGGETGGGVARG